ncbi:MAG TPA: hypothetical protein VF754_05135 [Pyrinomonadaceae bacterium]
MAEFKIGEIHETDVPMIEVTVGPNSSLPVGTHKFQLVVVDNDGNLSEPAFGEVFIKSLDRPTARIEALPGTVEMGKTFTLSGRGSTDIAPGKITKYIWTRLS